MALYVDAVQFFDDGNVSQTVTLDYANVTELLAHLHSSSGSSVQVTSTATEGESVANCFYIELDARHVPMGKILQVSYLVRHNSANIATSPLYLTIFEKSENSGEWVHAGTSTVTSTQALGQWNTFMFDPAHVELHGRPIRISLTDTPGVWKESYVIGLEVVSVTDSSDETVVIAPNGTGNRISLLPCITIMYLEENDDEQDITDHIENTTIHITADERAKWDGYQTTINNKVNNATFAAHTGNTDVHITAAERSKWNNIETIANNAVTSAQLANTNVAAAKNESLQHLYWHHSGNYSSLASLMGPGGDAYFPEAIHVTQAEKNKWNNTETIANNALTSANLANTNLAKEKNEALQHLYWHHSGNYSSLAALMGPTGSAYFPEALHVTQAEKDGWNTSATNASDALASAKKAQAAIDSASWKFPDEVAEALIPILATELSVEGPTASYNGTTNCCMLGAVYLPGSLALTYFGYRCKFDNLTGCTVDPMYLGIWEKSVDGSTWEKVGVSTNTQVQALGVDVMWSFNPATTKLNGRAIKYCLLRDRDEDFTEEYVMAVRTIPATDPDTKLKIDGSEWAACTKFFMRGYKTVDHIGINMDIETIRKTLLTGFPTNERAVRIGNYATVSDNEDHVIGEYAKGGGLSVAIGASAQTSYGGIHIGETMQGIPDGRYATSIGTYASALGDGSFALGANAVVSDAGCGVLRVQMETGVFTELMLISKESDPSMGQLGGEAGLAWRSGDRSDATWHYIKLSTLSTLADNAGSILALINK